jgi:hypothetical protein
MAILDEMQLLVSDLEAAFSRRIESEKERQETAGRDARYRAMGVREMRAAGAESARERLEEISKRSSEVAFMVDGFFRDRMAQAASDSRHRAMSERERRAESAAETRARSAECHELSAIWREHTAGMSGGPGAGAPRMPGRRFAQPPRRKAPEAAKPAAPRPAAKPEAPKAAASDNAEM